MSNTFNNISPTTSSQFLERNNLQQTIFESLQQNPLRASEIISKSNNSISPLHFTLEEFQIKFVMMASEIDRLLILNSLTNSEAERWRKKYLDITSISQVTINNTEYQQKYVELQSKFEMVNKNFETANEALFQKDSEISQLKNERLFANKNNEDVEYWKNKVVQAEAEYFDKVQSIKLQTQQILAGKIVFISLFFM